MRTLTSEEKLTLSKRLFPSFPSTFVRTLVQISSQQTLAFVQQKFRFFSFLFPFDIGNESRLKLRSAFVGIPKAAGNSSRLLHLRIEQKTHLRQKTCCFFFKYKLGVGKMVWFGFTECECVCLLLHHGRHRRRQVSQDGLHAYVFFNNQKI